ncbi:MFS transporter [Devosia sp. 2618]|uniref:MFS transporter n=1 Tax=Devosia sp. 2618 TaxID=3156454 RepID=UPI00339A6ED1
MSARGPFLALSVAQTLSLSGTRLSTIAIPWLMLTTTRDPVLTGFVAMLELLPYVVAKALGGPLIDRVGPKRVAIVCDFASVFVVGLIPLLHTLGLLSLPVLLPIVFLMGVLRGPSDAAKQAMVPDIAELADVPLERVTGVVGAIERLASSVGAAGAGALIGLIGSAEALWVNAATFALSALVVWWGIPRLQAAPKEQTLPATSYRQELLEGWNFLRSDAVLVSIIIMVATTNLLDQAYAAILLPVWTQDGGHGPELLGMLLAVFMAASIAGAAIAAMIGARLPRLPVYVIAFLLTGFPRFIIFAVDVPMAAIFATLIIGGFASGFLNPIISAVMFERIPRPLVGRVMSLNMALCWVLLPFGGLVGGAMITLAGLPMTLVVMGLVYLVVTLFPLARKSFREIEKRPVSNPV